MPRLVDVPDRHGGHFLRDDLLLSFFKYIRAATPSLSEYGKSCARIQEPNTLERRNLLCQRGEQFDGNEKEVFHKVMESIETRRSAKPLTTSSGKLFFRQEIVVNGKTYTCQKLRQYAESKGHIVLITATTGISA